MDLRCCYFRAGGSRRAVARGLLLGYVNNGGLTFCFFPQLLLLLAVFGSDLFYDHAAGVGVDSWGPATAYFRGRDGIAGRVARFVNDMLVRNFGTI